MSASSAVAIYGIDKIPVETAFAIGLNFFSTIGFDVIASGYSKYRKGRSEEDLDFVELSVVELKDEIRAGNVTSFRLFSENSSGRL